MQIPKHTITTELRTTKKKVRLPLPDERTHRMLDGLLEGKSAQRAAIDAGYGVRYARNYAAKMARSLRMKQAMLEHARQIKPGELADIAKVLVQSQLTSRKAARDPRNQLPYIRTALEMEGQLGGPSELHLHQHTALPPRVQKMLEDKMLELIEQKKAHDVDTEHADDTEDAESEKQDRQDDERIQSRDTALRVGKGTESAEAQSGDSDSA